MPTIPLGGLPFVCLRAGPAYLHCASQMRRGRSGASGKLTPVVLVRAGLSPRIDALVHSFESIACPLHGACPRSQTRCSPTAALRRIRVFAIMFSFFKRFKGNQPES